MIFLSYLFFHTAFLLFSGVNTKISPSNNKCICSNNVYVKIIQSGEVKIPSVFLSFQWCSPLKDRIIIVESRGSRQECLQRSFSRQKGYHDLPRIWSRFAPPDIAGRRSASAPQPKGLLLAYSLGPGGTATMPWQMHRRTS